MGLEFTLTDAPVVVGCPRSGPFLAHALVVMLTESASSWRFRRKALERNS